MAIFTRYDQHQSLVLVYSYQMPEDMLRSTEDVKMLLLLLRDYCLLRLRSHLRHVKCKCYSFTTTFMHNAERPPKVMRRSER